MEEVWKDIYGFNSGYQISSLGRVKSLRQNKPKIMSTRIKSYGNYKQELITFKYKGKCYGRIVARLVAQAFIPNPDNKKYVNHIDLNSLNQNVKNLEWCTAKENVNHSIKNNKNYYDNRKGNGTIFYNLDENVIVLYEKGYSSYKIAKIYNTCHRHILNYLIHNNITRRKTGPIKGRKRVDQLYV